MKKWDGCIKGKCELWNAVVDDRCALLGVAADHCGETGRFCQRKPVEAVVEYKQVKRITPLEMAKSGIDQSSIMKFYDSISGCGAGLMDDHEFHEYQKELAAAGLVSELEKAGFIRRVVSEIKKGSWVIGRHGCTGVVIVTTKDTHGVAWVNGDRLGTVVYCDPDNLMLTDSPIFND